MTEIWVPLLVALISVGAMLFGNYRMQRNMLVTHNKEKAIDLLVDTANELKDLYIEYWNGATHNVTCSLKIKIQQIRLSNLLDFADKKYKLADKAILDSEIGALIILATGDDFDSKKRTESEPDKCIKISSSINKFINELMHNKI